MLKFYQNFNNNNNFQQQNAFKNYFTRLFQGSRPPLPPQLAANFSPLPPPPPDNNDCDDCDDECDATTTTTAGCLDARYDPAAGCLDTRQIITAASPPMRFDKSSATDNIFQNSLYMQTPSAENILPFVQTTASADMTTTTNLSMINQEKDIFQNDLNRDGYFDPETKSIQQQQPPRPPDDGFGGAVAVNKGLYLQLRPSKITESDINVQGWDDIPQQVQQSQPPPYPLPPGGTAVVALDEKLNNDDDDVEDIDIDKL